MPNTTWKKHELRTALALGGKRTGNRGINTNDVDHDWLAIECKHRKTLPDWLTDAMRQAEANRDSAEKLAIVVLHQHGQRSANDFVVLRMKDFQEFFGSVPDCEEEELCANA